jgi:hypothetical protein
MEHPGRRVAIAEKALARMIEYCNEAAEAHEARQKQQGPRTKKAQDQLQTALESCVTGASGFSWFGNRAKRLIRVFMDHLAAYSRQCLTEDIAAAIGHFYVQLGNRLNDRVRDLTYCRQRLRHMQEALDYNTQTLEEQLAETTQANGESVPSPTPYMSSETFWDSIRESVTTSVVLPARETNLERAAQRFLATLTQEQMTQLDQSLQDHVLGIRGGLQKACLNTNDVLRHLAGPLVTQAVECLSSHLQITDVAQVEFSRGDTAEGDLAARIHKYHAKAEPLLGHSVGVASGSVRHLNSRSDYDFSSPSPAPGHEDNGNGKSGADPNQPTFLLIPASEAGKKYGELAHAELEGVHLVNVPGQADLMFCREQASLRVEHLERLIRACRAAYDESAHVPHTSAHARFDVQEWTPLDP